MSSFAAPNMTAVGDIGGASAWTAAIPGLSFGQGAAFTLEAWVKLRGASNGNAQLFTKDGEFSFSIANGMVWAGWQGGPALSGQTRLQPDTWYFVSATYDGQNLTVYLDGAQDAVLPYAGPGVAPTASTACIGALASANDPCDLWDLTIYSVARSPQQEDAAVWVDLSPSPGLLAHFDFSVAPCRETVSGLAMTPLRTAASFTLAPGILLDGTSSGLFIGDSAPAPITGPFSISVWVSFSSLTQTQTIMSYAPPTTTAVVAIGAVSENGAFNIYGTAGDIGGVTVPCAINADDWHNLALTYDGTTFTLYLDGLSIGSFQAPGFTTSAAGIWTLGFDFQQNGNKEHWLDGGLQWATAWSRCLSAAEVAFQQYGSVSDDAGVLFDISLDASPPVDLANNIDITLAGAATQYEQRVQVTSWTPPPAQLNPPGSEASPRPLRADWATPSDAVQGQPRLPDLPSMIAEGNRSIDTLMAGYAPETRSLWKARHEQGVREAFAAIEADPGLAAPGRWTREGAHDVYTYRHPVDGDMVLARVEADTLTACQMWWLSFVFTLLMGILNLLFISVTGKEMTDWIERRILGDASVMGMLRAIWASYPTFTGFTVIALLGGVYKAGLVRSFLWFVAYKIGYFGLAKLLVKLIALVSPAAAPATVLFATNAALLAVNLGTQVVGAPNIPGYSQSCPSGACDVAAA